MGLPNKERLLAQPCSENAILWAMQDFCHICEVWQWTRWPVNLAKCQLVLVPVKPHKADGLNLRALTLPFSYTHCVPATSVEHSVYLERTINSDKRLQNIQ